MRRAPPVSVTRAEALELERLKRHGASPGLRLRASVVLEAARGASNRAIAAELRIDPETAARWRRRFLAVGVEGILRQAPRPGRAARAGESRIERVLRALRPEPGRSAVGIGSRKVAQSLGVSHMTVVRARKIVGASPPPPPRARSEAVPVRTAEAVGFSLGPAARTVAFHIGMGSAAGPSLTPLREAAFHRSGGYRRPDPRLPAALRSLLLAPENAGPAAPKGSPWMGPREFLIFLRAAVERCPRGADLVVVTESRSVADEPRVRSWLGRHPTVRLLTVPPGARFVESVEGALAERLPWAAPLLSAGLAAAAGPNGWAGSGMGDGPWAASRAVFPPAPPGTPRRPVGLPDRGSA